MHLVQSNDQSARQRPTAYAANVMDKQKSRMSDGHIGDGLANRISQGLRAGEFHMMYQGVYHVGTGWLSRAEAQVRWMHPQYGLLLPGVFMSQLEQSDVAHQMSCFMVERTCHELSVCLAQGLKPCPVSLSVYPFVAMSEGFATDIREIARSYGVAPNLLEIELPESEDAARVLSVRVLTEALRDLGVGISYGEFGAGRASLASLGALDMDTVKLAREWVASVPDEPRSCKVVEGLLALFETLDVRVVVSGVETEEQARWLGRWGGALAQGGFYSRPVRELAGMLE
ncbi:EAL domain-containing protein [Paraburkholderia phenazinium]|jgi:EAL domain-containing protein (putative c-di-GMP-specific phosphodiesterase class I)|uniref:EAL domain, c-di-GMP-specific phosphodiesterase class I (Or its enzymatically inactive variant) n=1 Tax=Paraburkholderia phenazinium TaxID=60549 RepID=A0A1G7QBE1_9BURK|nr:EAL domain-containing protein [Paraburkholderia phenazinium]SDF95755.1 EAL domain, c-di-GMP-specific phosphodiesterase class I (or its enzymatically inactive variant) [Paraburkholderia phenazinium]